MALFVPPASSDQLPEDFQDYHWRSLSFLWKKWKKFHSVIFISIGVLTSSSLLVMSSARLMGIFIEEGLKNKNYSQALTSLLLIIVCEVLAIFLFFYGKKKLLRIAGLCLLQTRNQCIGKIQTIPLPIFDRWSKGKIITRLTHDIEEIECFFSGPLGRLCHAFILIVVAFFAMCLTHWKLGLALMVATFPLVYVAFIARKKIRFYTRTLSQINGHCNGKIYEFVNALEDLDIYNQKILATESLSQLNLKQRQTFFKLNFFYGLLRPLSSFLCHAPLLLFILLGGFFALSHRLDLALFVTFLRYCERFTHPMLVISREIHLIEQAMSSMERVVAFLQLPDESNYFNYSLPKQQQQRDLTLSGQLSLKNIWMQYQHGHWVLKNLTLSINPGETVGIIGPSGSGKSSCFKLMTRSYPFQQGQITFDHIPIEELSLNHLRKNIGIINQEPLLFAGTVRDNLTHFVAVDDKKIFWAMEQSGLLALFQTKKISLDHPIAEFGKNLSSGEVQLLAMTRLLLLNPRILLLDEATSQIDSILDSQVQQCLQKLFHQRTSLIVSHRPSTLRHCHRIIVLDQGQVVQQGTFKELLAQEGFFLTMFKQHQLLQDSPTLTLSEELKLVA